MKKYGPWIYAIGITIIAIIITIFLAKMQKHGEKIFIQKTEKSI